MIQEFEEQEKAKLNTFLAVNPVNNNNKGNNDLNSNDNDRSPIDDSNPVYKMKVPKLLHDNILHSAPIESISNNLNSSTVNNTLHPNINDHRGSLKEETSNFQQKLPPLISTGNVSRVIYG